MRRPSFTYANVMSTLGVFMALGGTSYAVARNSIGTAQLKNGAVTSAKVRNGTLTAGDVAGGVLSAGRGPRGAAGPGGPAGPAGSVGPAGLTGLTGPRGPSDGYVDNGPNRVLAQQANVQTRVAQLASVPAGSYVFVASWHIGDFANGGSITGCNINVNGEYISGSDSVVGNGSGSTRVAAMSTTAGVTRGSSFQVTLECRTDQALGSPPTVFNPRLTAIRLETLRATSG